MSQIDRLPDFQWSEVAATEMREQPPAQLILQSDFAYRLGNIAVVGLIYHSLTSPPWMWFALARGVTLRDLIDFRRMQDMIPRGTLVAVWEEDKVADRFARFYGFDPTEDTIPHGTRTYRLYRRA